MRQELSERQWRACGWSQDAAGRRRDYHARVLFQAGYLSALRKVPAAPGTPASARFPPPGAGPAAPPAAGTVPQGN